MEQPCEPDTLLRGVLADPQAAVRPVLRARGFATRRLAIAALDAAQVIGAGLVSAPAPLGERLGPVLGLSVAASLLAMSFRRAARSTSAFTRVSVGAVARRAALASATACGVVLLPVALAVDMPTARTLLPWIAVWASVAGLVSFTIRSLPVPLIRRVSARAIRPTAAVVGTAGCVRTMTDMLSGYGTHHVIAEIDPDDPRAMADLERLARRGALDKVVIVGVPDRVVDRICLALGDAPTAVCFGLTPPSASTFLAGQSHAAKNPPLLPLLPNPLDDWRSLFKRAFDLTLVIASVPAVAPIFALVAVAIRLESPGPIFFRQWRFGLGSRPTLVLKFRTMYHDQADRTGEARTLRRDPRVTVVGRWLRRTSIDELPQLVNVLRGDMSLVGPRPHATHMKVGGLYYFEAVRGYRIRHRVKPGITGWAQVTGSRGEVDTIEKAIDRLHKDLWYVRNWSLALDLRILLRTVLGGFVSLRAD